MHSGHVCKLGLDYDRRRDNQLFLNWSRILDYLEKIFDLLLFVYCFCILSNALEIHFFVKSIISAAMTLGYWKLCQPIGSSSERFN